MSIVHRTVRKPCSLAEADHVSSFLQHKVAVPPGSKERGPVVTANASDTTGGDRCTQLIEGIDDLYLC